MPLYAAFSISCRCDLDDSILSLLRLFVLATGHTLLGMFLNIWRQFLFPGNLHDVAL